LDGLAGQILTAALSSLPTSLDEPRVEFARRCRQLWIEQLSSPERNVEPEFLRNAEEVRARFGAESLTDEELWETVQAEYERVQTASTVAELMLPKLTALVRQRGGPGPSTPAPYTPPANGTPHAQQIPAQETSAPRSPLSVADLIEGMLDQQRSEARNRPPPHRS
jgi:hypothetical protein